MEFLELSGGRRIACNRSEGAQPGIAFLGGYSSDMEGSKALFLESWARERGIGFLRFDYTGHGKSSGKFEEGCIGDWARDAVETISELAPGGQILVGSSMGGWISLLIVRDRPELAKGLVGIAAAPDFTRQLGEALSPEQSETVRRDGAVRIETDRPDEPLIISRRLLEDGPRNFVMDRPLRLHCPVRFLQGTEDAEVDQSVAIRLLNHVEGDDVSLLLEKGADHRFSTPACLELLGSAVESARNASLSACA